MKFYRWNKHYLGWGITAFIVIIASILFFMMLSNMENIGKSIENFIGAVSPIMYGFIIAYLLAPVVETFEKRVFGKMFTKYDFTYTEIIELKKKNGTFDKESGDEKYPQLKRYIKNKPRRIISITLTFVIFIGIITGIMIAIIPQIVATLRTIVTNIPSYLENVTNWISETFESYPEVVSQITNAINDAGSTLLKILNENIIPQMGDYLGFLTSGIMSLVGLILNILFGIVVAIYCLYSKELFAAQAKKLVYTVMNVKHANRMITSIRKIHHSFGNFITGTIIDSFVVGCITFVATTIAGVPFAMLVSVIMGLTNIIPVFGPFIGIVPGLLLIFMENPVMCIPFTIIVIIIQNVNGNILSPKIIGGSTGLTSFWVIFAILVGQGIFGFWGLIIGIPIFAVVYSALKSFISGKLESKGLPSGSDQYTDIDIINADDLEPVSLADTLAAEELEKRRIDEQKKEEKRQKRRKILAIIPGNKGAREDSGGKAGSKGKSGNKSRKRK